MLYWQHPPALSGDAAAPFLCNSYIAGDRVELPCCLLASSLCCSEGDLALFWLFYF